MSKNLGEEMDYTLKDVFGTVFCSNPYVICLNSANLSKLEKEIPSEYWNKRIYFIIGIWYSLETRHIIKLSLGYYRYRIRRPKHKIYYLANTIREKKLLSLLGIPSIYCNQNCFIDKDIFAVSDKTDKKYLAIYNAAIAPFKRHYLAAKVNSLALIYHRFWDDQEYWDQVRNVLPHASWLNGLGEEYRDFSAQEIMSKLNESTVGLCLSKVEGAMYASAEYLLCGLPVVSTPNKGGRNVFFDKRFVRIVKPHSFAIARAVQDLASQRIDPFCIREETIKKMIPHEQRFIALLQRVFAEAGIKKDAAMVYRRKYVNKLRGKVSLDR